MTSHSEPIFVPTHCPRCQYKQQGHEGSICPECGLDFNSELKRYFIPWEREKTPAIIGFPLTILMILLSPRKTRFQFQLPLSTRQALSFKWISSCLLILAWTAAFAIFTFERRLENIFWNEVHPTILIWANVGACLGLCLTVPLIIDSHLWFCRKHTENQTAINCIGQYSASPFLIWTLFLFALTLLWRHFEVTLDGVLPITLLITLAACMLDACYLAFRLIRASGRKLMLTLILTASLPIIWCSLLFVAMIVMPYALYTLCMIYAAYRNI